jgi:hypothetical protein
MSKNDITGDRLVTKTSTTAYDEGYDRIFGKKNMRAIYYWPDGTWCDLEEYPSYTHKSDDVARIYLSFDYSDDQIQGLVDAACSRG